VVTGLLSSYIAVSGHGQPTMSRNWFERFQGVDQLNLALALYSGFWTYGGTQPTNFISDFRLG